MESVPKPVELNVLRIGTARSSFMAEAKGKECYACGNRRHLKNSPQCPARNQFCNGCGKRGHFLVKCRNVQASRPGTSKPSTDDYRPSQRRKTNANLIEDVQEEAEEKTSYLFSLNPIPKHMQAITLQIGGVKVPNLLINSGAACNVVEQETWRWLKNEKIKADTRKSAKTLYAYGSSKPLLTMGTFTVEVISKDTKLRCVADFVVMNGEGHRLLGRDTAECLGLLHVGPVQINLVNISDVLDRYPELFKGVGLLKNYELGLHVDSSVTPIVQPLRRVPFQLQKKVDKKLNELMQAGIIEKVPEGPTTWISPLVVIPKPDGDIRVCLDMRRVNEAIVRERHPIPMMEKLLIELNGGAMFSKLDLKWGFHQIMINEGSRPITTFVTHRKLYRYK